MKQQLRKMQGEIDKYTIQLEISALPHPVIARTIKQEARSDIKDWKIQLNHLT